MASLNRELIQYHGIDTTGYEHLPHFKQVHMDFTFCTPICKPEIEQIMKIWITPCVIQQKIVRTPQGMSIEGLKVTGYKLMLSGDLFYKVEYVGCEEHQKLYTAQMVMPFCGYVVLPSQINDHMKVAATALIEDIYSEKLDSRCVYNNVTMILVADIY